MRTYQTPDQSETALQEGTEMGNRQWVRLLILAGPDSSSHFWETKSKQTTKDIQGKYGMLAKKTEGKQNDMLDYIFNCNNSVFHNVYLTYFVHK